MKDRHLSMLMMAASAGDGLIHFALRVMGSILINVMVWIFAIVFVRMASDPHSQAAFLVFLLWPFTIGPFGVLWGILWLGKR